jgi:hypothetical protein
LGEREHRVAENQSIFRDVNEVRPVAAEDEWVEFLCECGDLVCTERVTLTQAEYEAIRADPRQFLLLPGHELLESEEVVTRNERFLLVRKFGEAGEIAEELDTRLERSRGGEP